MLLGNYVYSAKTGGEFLCLKAATGEEIWKTNAVTDLINGASIHVTGNGNSAFLFNDRGELIQARLAPSGYEEISRTKLIEPTSRFGSRKVAWAAPAFARQNVYARNDQELISVSLAANLYPADRRGKWILDGRKSVAQPMQEYFQQTLLLGGPNLPSESFTASVR